MYGHKISNVFSHCFIGEGPGHLVVKEQSYCNHGCFFDCGGDITIGKNCAIAMNVSFINGTHVIGPHEKRAGKGYVKPTLIEDGCWIGANCVILPGVTIHAGCIIAAGAVVTKDCEPDGLYAGVPAKRIKNLN